MTARRVALAGALALLLGACGNDSVTAVTSGGGGDGGGGGGGENGGLDSFERCPHGVTLRLAGKDPGAVSALTLSLGSVNAAYEEGGPAISITGTFLGPHMLSAESTSTVGVLHLRDQLWPYTMIVLTFSGGAANLGESCGSLDVCSGPLAFHLDPGLVKPETCQVSVVLNIGRSVAATDGGLAFLPQFRIVY